MNQSAYTMMTDDRAAPETNRYYRPKLKAGSEEYKSLTRDTIRRHLRGEITCMFYASNAITQLSKWSCLDADYPEAESDLSLLRVHFESLGLCPLLEQSRRGGHLWLFFAEPLKSVQVRVLLLDAIRKNNLSVFTGDVNLPGIEIFPRQDYLEEGRLGNGIRGPLGVHRKDFKRYWFKDCPQQLGPQLSLLMSTKTLTQESLNRLTYGLEIPPQNVAVMPGKVECSAFSIFDHFPVPARSSADYKVKCPACFSTRLVITSRGSRKGFYHCFTGCTTAAIRAALGQPLRSL